MPWSEVKNDYVFAHSIPSNERIRSSEPIVEKSDCHVVLLSGVIGSGKTTWAKKYITENPGKNFNLLNVEHVLSKMTVRTSARLDGVQHLRAELPLLIVRHA